MTIIYNFNANVVTISKKKSKQHLLTNNLQSKATQKEQISESLLLFRTQKKYKRRCSPFDFEIIYAHNQQNITFPRYLLLHIGIQDITRVKANVVSQLVQQNKNLLGENAFLYIKEYSDKIVLFELSKYPIQEYYSLFYNINLKVENQAFINLPAIATLEKLNETQIIKLEHDIFINKYICSMFSLYNNKASTLHRLFSVERFVYCKNVFLREFRLRQELLAVIEDEYDVQKIVFKQYKIVLLKLNDKKNSYYHIVNDEQLLELLVPITNRNVLLSYIKQNKPFSLNAMKKLIGIPRCNVPILLDYFKVANRYKKIMHPSDPTRFKILLRSCDGTRDRKYE